MTRLSNADLGLIRQRPQSTELYLSIFSPRTVLAASVLVTGTMAQGMREIGYNNVTTGSYTSVEAGMTLLVGTTDGGRELGKVRIKSASASQLVVAENNHIDWTLATYLTVKRYWEVWPVYPRIIPDPNDPENVIFYKDYDIAYSNQNTILGAFPCAGTHRALFTGESTYWSSSGTTHLLGSALTYDWSFEGGTPSSSTSAVPGNVQYNTPGDYVTRLIVTGANGSTDTTYRYVSVRNNPKNSNQNIPKRNWSMGNLSGSRAEGGYTLDLTVTEENITVYDGDVVVLFADDWYGSVNQSFGGNSHNNSKIFFVGHIIGSTIQYNYKRGSVSFQVGSITDLMKQSEGFSVSVESKATPAKWFELLDMDGRRALYHYLKWHSTVLSVADFAFVGQDQKIQFFDSDRESIFDAVDNYMRETLLGDVCSDRQGKIWAEVGAWATSNPTGSFPPVMQLTKADWKGELSIQHNLLPSLSFLELGGVAYSGTTTGTFDAFISNAPGQVPNVRGTTERHQGLALASQSQLNELAGNQYANRNAEFPRIDAELSGNYRNLDIAPQETVGAEITADDANIGKAINAPYLVDSMAWTYDSQKKVLWASSGLAAVVNGTSGETVLIPDIPDDGGYGDFGGGFNFSPGAFPPFLSSLSNLVSGKWQGSFSPAESIPVSFVVTGTSWNYGNFGLTWQPIVPVGGIYLVNLILQFTSPTGLYNHIVDLGMNQIHRLYYDCQSIYDNTNPITFSDQIQIAAGTQLNINSANPSGGYGNFFLSLILLHTL